MRITGNKELTSKSSVSRLLAGGGEGGTAASVVETASPSEGGGLASSDNTFASSEGEGTSSCLYVN